MVKPPTDPLTVDPTDHRHRDAASQKMLGFFFTTLGVLVLAGTLWSLDSARAVIVNLASGSVLVAIGGGMMVVSRRAKTP